MTQLRVVSPAAVAACAALAVGGMLAHNLLELGPAFLLSPETLLPIAIYALLVVFAFRAASGIGVRLALVAWVLLNLVGGGILSVLPLAILPFVPEQSGAHYAAHVVYVVAQVPLLLIAIGAVRSGRASTADVAPR
jgi:hypothetical protein